MGVPSPGEVNAMKNLMTIMNGGSGSKSNALEPKVYQAEYINPAPNNFVPGGSTGLTDADVKDMRLILERFNKATNNTVKTLVEESKYDSELKEALITKSTQSGTQIGVWEIRIKIQETASGKERQLYDIVNSSDESKIASNLILYEAAYGIVKYLNKGISPLSKEIHEILNLEEKYNQFRTDAVRFKQRASKMIKGGDRSAGLIFESRFSDSKDKALVIHSRLKNLVKTI